MKLKQQLMTIAVAAALGCATSAMALTKAEIKTEKDRIAAEFKASKAKCDDLKGNAKDICMAEAKGTNKVAKAELEARDKDTAKARYNVRIARAEAGYDVARERCDDLSGNTKGVCVKDAKAALEAAKADVTVDRVASSANQKVAEARQEANADKRDASFAAAKERCDVYSGEVKERCVADAKARFNVK